MIRNKWLKKSNTLYESKVSGFMPMLGELLVYYQYLANFEWAAIIGAKHSNIKVFLHAIV